MNGRRADLAREQLITLAHQGGWDEITAAVAGPLLVIGVLGWILSLIHLSRFRCRL
ncbi:hypothetical protein [Streptomyces specialis]|uniref:hypothetical protein n=1 Tax=Streptomyces specialis TaxID=498367 RepID=UPI000AF9DCBE|nr:hypothetical protein [Streptomyces specialis]